MIQLPNEEKARQALIEDFRAYLHTVITAAQFGQSARLAHLPGAKTANYCRSLAKLPDNILAHELAAPVLAIIEQIENASLVFSHPLFQKQIKDPVEQAEFERVLEQLDFALAFILRRVSVNARLRAKCTKCSDLMVDATWCVIGDGGEAAHLLRRYQREFPEDIRGEDGKLADGGFPEGFAWDVYQRVEVLDRLVDDFPEHIRLAARQMHGWPMLVYRHGNNRKHFEEVAARLELGVNYPLDASEGARFRPNTPLVRYLDSLVFNVDYVRHVTVGRYFESTEKELDALRHRWWDTQDDRPGDAVVDALRFVPKLPPLTKLTATEWAEKALVPIILATDAHDWKNCEEPALQAIARQRGVKSRATFKSRLLSAVSATLRRLARPA
jgi:hypothetical protein